MNLSLQFVINHGCKMALGASILMSLSGLATCFVASPLRRQRISEGTFLGVFLWIALYFIPLPAVRLPESFKLWNFETSFAVTPTGLPPIDAIAGMRTSRTVSLLDAAELAPFADAAALTREGQLSVDTIPSPARETESIGRTAAGAVASVNWFACFAGIYLVGAVGAIMCLAWGSWTVGRWVSHGQSAGDELADWFGAEKRDTVARLLLSDRCPRPICFGVFRPSILLPTALVESASRDAIRCVIRHELAHIQHRDALGRTISNLLMPLVFWQPLYWWLRRVQDTAAELRADDCAARQCDPADYVAALTQLVRVWKSHSAGAFVAAGAFGSESSFYWRMNMILSNHSMLERRIPLRWKLAVCGFAAMAVVATASALQQQSNQDKSKGDATIDEPRREARPTSELPVNSIADRMFRRQMQVDKAKVTDVDNQTDEVLNLQRVQSALSSEIVRLANELQRLELKHGPKHPTAAACRLKRDQLLGMLRKVEQQIEPLRNAKRLNSEPSNLKEKNASKLDDRDAFDQAEPDAHLIKELEELKERFGHDHPKVLSLQRKIESGLPRKSAERKVRVSPAERRRVSAPVEEIRPRRLGKSDEPIIQRTDVLQQKEMQQLQLQMQAKVDELRQELAQLQGVRSEWRPLEELPRTAMPSSVGGGLPSIALLRHQQRMAKASLEVFHTEIEVAKDKLAAAEKLFEKRMMPEEQLRETQVVLAKSFGQLRRAQLEIESLEQAIKDAEAEWRRFENVKGSAAPSQSGRAKAI